MYIYIIYIFYIYIYIYIYINKGFQESFEKYGGLDIDHDSFHVCNRNYKG